MGILGCGEPGKNPLPGLEIGRAQGICAMRHVVMEGQGLLQRKGLFLVTFFGPAKKVTPPGGLK